MPLEPTAELPERETFFDGEIHGVRECGVEPRTDVAVREDEPVPLLPIGALRIVRQDMKIERSEDIRHAQGAGRVAAPGCDQHRDDGLADLLGRTFKGAYVFVCQCHLYNCIRRRTRSGAPRTSRPRPPGRAPAE